MVDGEKVDVRLLLQVLPMECWQLIWEMMQKVPVSGDAVDYAAQTRVMLRELGADKRRQ